MHHDCIDWTSVLPLGINYSRWKCSRWLRTILRSEFVICRNFSYVWSWMDNRCLKKRCSAPQPLSFRKCSKLHRPCKRTALLQYFSVWSIILVRLILCRGIFQLNYCIFKALIRQRKHYAYSILVTTEFVFGSDSKKKLVKWFYRFAKFNRGKLKPVRHSRNSFFI